ncbi:hypothetical protein Sjap_003032 [Stephania japonica]|uniref:Uncharacterized protein n=1 Tax=Stephania japonica TaxID=461633 RepID=A0AAP0KQ53_9MAGN
MFMKIISTIPVALTSFEVALTSFELQLELDQWECQQAYYVNDIFILITLSFKYWDECLDPQDLEALWGDPEVSKQRIGAREDRGQKVHLSRDLDGQPYLTQTEMKNHNSKNSATEKSLSGIRELRWATRARSRPSPTTTTHGSDVQRQTAAQRGEETSENERERERKRKGEKRSSPKCLLWMVEVPVSGGRWWCRLGEEEKNECIEREMKENNESERVREIRESEMRAERERGEIVRWEWRDREGGSRE